MAKAIAERDYRAVEAVAPVTSWRRESARSAHAGRRPSARSACIEVDVNDHRARIEPWFIAATHRIVQMQRQRLLDAQRDGQIFTEPRGPAEIGIDVDDRKPLRSSPISLENGHSSAYRNSLLRLVDGSK
jgi:hypothetical protein